MQIRQRTNLRNQVINLKMSRPAKPHATKFIVHPLTPSRWADVEDLFGPEKGANSGCWCMWPRVTSSEFRAYVERVFRDQNKVSSDLAFALDDATASGGSAPPALTAAEDALLKACAGLNELATSRRDQADLGVRKSATAARSAPDCERATQAAQTAMREHPR